MPYQPPKLTDLIARSHAYIQSKLPGAKTSLKNSVLGALAYCLGALTSGLYHFIAWVSRQVVPNQADDDIFLAYAAEDGIFRKSASQARGTIICRAEAQAVIVRDVQLQSTEGILYKVLEEAQGQGDIEVQVMSIEAGLDQNIAAGALLSFVSPVLHVQNKATVQLISGGADIEPMNELRARYVYYCQYPPQGGSQFDYVRWVRETAGVTRAWCYPRIRGGNTVGVAWVYDGREKADDPEAVLPTAVDVETVMTYLDHHQDPVTGGIVGHSAGAEVINMPLSLNRIDPVITLFPNDEAIRANVEFNLKNAINALAMPSGSIPRSHLTQAISNAAGEYDHRLVEPPESQPIITAGLFELLVLGEITWQ